MYIVHKARGKSENIEEVYKFRTISMGNVNIQIMRREGGDWE